MLGVRLAQPQIDVRVRWLALPSAVCLVSGLLLAACERGSQSPSANDQSASVTPWAPTRPECVAPAKPGGGFDLTCRLASEGLAQAGLLSGPMNVRFHPGGVGAVAMAKVLAARRPNPNQIVAFSAGSVLNIAQQKFGAGVTMDSVRWLAAAGVDYGAYVVQADAPWLTLDDLASDLVAAPERVAFGAGGTVGSQDWMKTALLFQQLSLDPKHIRYVAYEGGGDAMAALLGGHVQVMPGDVAELVGLLGTGRIRVLAVLAQDRLGAPFADLPTAREQGFDLVWPIFRGYYLAPSVTTEQYQWWQAQFVALQAKPEFANLQQQRGLLPLPLAGDAFANYVAIQAQRYEQLAKQFRLLR